MGFLCDGLDVDTRVLMDLNLHGLAVGGPHFALEVAVTWGGRVGGPQSRAAVRRGNGEAGPVHPCAQRRRAFFTASTSPVT